jgi:hypothetical protein
MINPFSGIIDSNLKAVFNNAISAILADGALTIPCTLDYGVTKYENCANCVFDPIGRKSANRFQDGGPVPFPYGGVCPLCNGGGRRGLVSTENVSLAVVFDTRHFLEISTPVNTADGFIQTIANKEMTPKLARAKEIVVATDVSGYFSHRYQRVSEPTPVGLGGNDFVFCTWRRSG